MSTSSTLSRTPLYPLHEKHSAKIVPFAGYEMPVNYPDGILAEHQHTRRSAGLFDVSHMGQIVIRAKNPSESENIIATQLESLIPADILSLPLNRQKYGLLTNDQGGILDDLMVQNLGDHFMVVVNAACKQQDFDHLKKHLSDTCELELRQDLALLALQGPASAAAVAKLGHDLADMKFMDVRSLEINGIACTLSRSGYSGEDGFEISVANEQAEPLANLLLADSSVKPVGLGARDSLRLEAGLCLYGQDITTTTTPVEAALNWAISPARRQKGERSGGFPGADIILPQMPKNIERIRVGLLPEGRAPIRPSSQLFDAKDNPIGEVTSGGFSPSLGHPISMGYVKLEHATPANQIFASVRGKNLPVSISNMPFVANNFYR